MIPVTKSFFPTQELYNQYLTRIWDNEWLTNRGELVLELEQKLKDFLEIKNVFVTTNGTLPLQMALKSLKEGGEIITTPFSYIATTSSIIWENYKPIFVDIHPEFLSIDETKIEEAITSKTRAILATHVFGNPCAIEAIDRIAKKYDLKVIYDAAHCFGVKYNGKSIFQYGDISTCSFHATKIFHSGEGGAIFCNDDELFAKLFYSHNFGHNGPLDFHGLGINAKMSELQAAMGLSVWESLDEIFESRKNIVEFYRENLNLSRVSLLKLRENTQWNYSYFPVIFKNEEKLLKCMKALNEKDIFPRRYFYPSLNTLKFTGDFKMPISEDIASKILCLPLYKGLQLEEVNKIVNIINN